MVKPTAWIVMGQGINCGRESAEALEAVGFHCEKLSWHDGIKKIDDFQFIFFPGGFSYGDYWGSGQLMSALIRSDHGDILSLFVKRGGLILGVCNGFQILTRLGLLPGGENTCVLLPNVHGKFINRWVDLDVTGNSVFLEGIRKFRAPIRHGEGRLTPLTGKLDEKYHAIKYNEDVNGSYQQLAGIQDSTGQVLGLMPHPEAAIYLWQDPEIFPKSENFSTTRRIFENAHRFISTR